MKVRGIAAAAATATLILAGAAPAAASDGEWVGIPHWGAKFYGDTDTFVGCSHQAGLADANLQWKTATLGGTHKVNSDGRGCNPSQRFDHAFLKGAKVSYRICNSKWTVCSKWSSGISES